MIRSSLPKIRVIARIALVPTLWLCTAGVARAEPLVYHPVPAVKGSASAEIALPYTFGTHNFEASELAGEVRVDWQAAPVVTGRLTLPLDSLHGGGDTLNCHMREAMGLDYARSQFPRNHVCSGGQLPATGNDAVAFPDITFEIKRVVVDPAHTRSGEYEFWRATAVGRWTIHGVTRDDSIELRLTVPAGEGAHPRWVQVEGAHKIRLADYGIQVKRALVISAGDTATLKLGFQLREGPRPRFLR
jgi:hypothetical protein